MDIDEYLVIGRYRVRVLLDYQLPVTARFVNDYFLQCNGPLVFRGCAPILTGTVNYFMEAEMIAGIVLIIAGVLLVAFPPLLSLIVAAFLIFAGAVVVSIAYQERKLQRHSRNPVVEFFFRY